MKRSKTPIIMLRCITLCISVLTVIILLAAGSHYASAITISEIMFNPEGADSGREWIELDLEGECLNLTTYRLFEQDTNHKIYPVDSYDGTGPDDGDIACNIAIISNDADVFLSEYPQAAGKLKVFKSSFSLSNTGEYLAIKFNNETFSGTDYGTIISQAGNIPEGYDLERLPDGWTVSETVGGTPGILRDRNEGDVNGSDDTPDAQVTINDTVNNTAGNISINTTINMTYVNNTADHNATIGPTINNTINNTMNYTDTNANVSESTNITIIANNSIFANNSINGTTNTTMTANNATSNNTNITNNSTNNMNNDPDDTEDNISHTVSHIANCTINISIEIKNESATYLDGTPIKFYNRPDIRYLNGTKIQAGSKDYKGINYTIEYWVEDLFGNIEKNKISTANDNEKSFTPDIGDFDRILVIRNAIRYSNCEIINNSGYKIILIQNPGYIPPTCPICTKSCPSCSKSSCDCSNSYSKTCEPCTCKNQSCQAARQANSSSEKKNDTKISSLMSENSRIFNNTDASRTEKAGIATSYAQYSSSSQADTGSPINNSTIHDAGHVTGAIIYESPDLKNRLYALIGLVLVISACSMILIYKAIMRRRQAKEHDAAHPKLPDNQENNQEANKENNQGHNKDNHCHNSKR